MVLVKFIYLYMYNVIIFFLKIIERNVGYEVKVYFDIFFYEVWINDYIYIVVKVKIYLLEYFLRVRMIMMLYFF